MDEAMKWLRSKPMQKLPKTPPTTLSCQSWCRRPTTEAWCVLSHLPSTLSN
ncbi:hypothetical protein RBSWK_04655 [Rhodopirellula baltica SWK14]|uniref:Uncharacterized protein n=1 Tax=Rhodopirellula baltica SWK14 TaxID=993516 RepID=L7CB63_RHOBT|nr:hypothetical protein RBSWK_04655 [Rhodopirellula baltica SWK14]